MKKTKLISKILMTATVFLFLVLASANLVSVTSAEGSIPWGIDNELIEMIDRYAGQYYHDFWSVSLSQYKSWIALITLREAGYGRYAAHSQYGGGYDGDKFNHIDVGYDFPFSTGVGAFQLDRGGDQGDANENWGILPTIVKLNPRKALLSVLRWHRDRFGDSSLWTGATLVDFSTYSAWLAVQPSKESEFAVTWEEITGKAWNECKDIEIDVSFTPPSVTDPFENSVEYIGRAYWHLAGWEGYWETWLVQARSWSGAVVTEYYYTYDQNSGWEQWVWNDPNHELKYRYARRFTAGPFPEGRIDTGNPSVAGTTDDNSGLDPYDRSPTLVDVVLIIDSSGSMSWNDPDDQRKEAARVFVQQARDQDQIAIIDFSDWVRVLFSLEPRTSDPSAILTAIDQVGEYGTTNIRGGVLEAYQQLENSTSGNRKAAILLTDGAHNVGGYANAHWGFVNACWPIYTLGLYQPGNSEREVGEPLLQQIADETGGEYIHLEDPTQLIQVYNQIAREVLSGDLQLDTAVPLLPGQTMNLAVNIPVGQSQANFLTAWKGSTVDTTLVAPNGTVIDSDTLDLSVYHAKGLTYELYRITDPQPGEWTVVLFGADLPDAGEEVTVQVFTVPSLYIEVAVDIKPGSYPKSINLRAKGVIPVAILTTIDFDASTVDVTSVRFGPSEAAPTHYAFEDVDGDGDIDMILQFKILDTGIQAGDTEATITGMTVGGMPITGTDSLQVVPRK